MLDGVFFVLRISTVITPEEEKHIPFFVEKVNNAGYAFEEHRITTEDKYVLTAWRIPGRVNESIAQRSIRKPVLLQHGLFDTSYTWLILNKTESLGLLLAYQG